MTMAIGAPVEFPGAAESAQSIKELADSVRLLRKRVNETSFSSEEYGARLNDLAGAKTRLSDATRRQTEELKRLQGGTGAAAGSIAALRAEANASQEVFAKTVRGTKEYDAAAVKLAASLKALRTEEETRAKDLGSDATPDAPKKLSGSDMAKAVFSDDLVRRVENFGGVAVDASSKLSAFAAVGITAAAGFAALTIAAVQVNSAIEEHRQEVAAALAESTKFAERQDLMRKAMDGSAESARELGVSVSDTATRQEIQTAIINKQSEAYIYLGRSIDASIKAAEKSKKEQEQGNEGLKSLGLSIAKGALGPIPDLISAAGAGLGKLKTLSADYQREQEQKAQAAAFQQYRIWEIEVAQTTEQLKQLSLAREKAEAENQVLLHRLQDLGIQSALGERALSTGEQIAALDDKINASRERRGELLNEEARANEAFANKIANGFAMQVRFTALQADFQKDEVSRQTQLNAIKQQTNQLESQRAELMAKQEREKDQTLQLKLQTDQLEYQIAQKGVVIDLGGQSLSQTDRVALVQARINELTENGRKTWSQLPAEIQKSVLALGGMLNTELDAVKQQQDQAKAQRDAARAKGHAAEQAEKQRRAAQLELQIQNEVNIAFDRQHNQSIARLDIAQKIHATEASLQALNLSGERVSQRQLDRAKDLSATLDKLKSAQGEIAQHALEGLGLDKIFASQAFGQNIEQLAVAMDVESKLFDLRKANALSSADQLTSALVARREGNQLTVEQNDALLNQQKILDGVTQEQIRNNEQLVLAKAQLAAAKNPTDELAATERLDALSKTSMHLITLKDALSEAQLSANAIDFSRVNNELRKLVENGEGMERIGANIRLGLRTALGPENARIADQSAAIIGNALGGIESGFKNVVKSIIEGKDIGQVLAEQGKVILTNLALEASWKAAMAFATGLFQLATYQYPQAASSFAAGAAFAGVAALGGLAAAAIPSSSSSPSTPSLSAGRESRNNGGRSPSLNSSSSGQSGTVIYNISYDGNTLGTANDVRYAIREAIRDTAVDLGVPRELAA